MASYSNPPRALITGIQGFTGNFLSAELQVAGYDVYGTSCHPQANNDKILQVDLRDADTVHSCVQHLRPNIIAHLAAISFVAHGDATEIYNTNLIGTRNLLVALSALPEPPQSVLLASSSNIYGNSTVDRIDETVPPAPVNDYAVSKLAMEYMARLWFDKLPIILVRPFNYTGHGQAKKFLLPKIVEHFKRGEREIQLGNVNVARDFSDVRSVCRAYAKLLQLAPAGEIFNICSGRAFSLQQVLDIMSRIAGYSINVSVNPAYIREKDVMRLRGSNNRLKACCGKMEWIPLEETLSWMFTTQQKGIHA